MRLGGMAKAVLPPELRPDQLDGKTWHALAEHFDSIHLIALAPDRRFHRARTGKIELYLLPNVGHPLLKGVLFALLAPVLAIWLTWREGIAVWSMSEVISALCGLPIRLLTRARVVFQVQGELLHFPAESYAWWKRSSIRLATLLACRIAHRIRVVSQRGASQLMQAGVPAQKVAVVPTRCDTRVFDPAIYTQERDRLRAELGAGPGQTLVIFVGRLHPTKGVTFILQATAELAKQYRNFHVAIVGGGPLDERLRQQAADLGLTDDLVTFTGPVPYAQVPAMLAAADLFLSPSLDEGMPRAVLEALAMELPVVVTDVGGNGEILSGGDCGRILPPRDVPAIVAAVAGLLEDPAQARRMGRCGRQVVLERYDFVPQIRAFADCHRELAPGR